jgi:hypothetical protein
VLQYSPPLADKVAGAHPQLSITKIAAKLAEVLAE